MSSNIYALFQITEREMTDSSIGGGGKLKKNSEGTMQLNMKKK